MKRIASLCLFFALAASLAAPLAASAPLPPVAAVTAAPAAPAAAHTDKSPGAALSSTLTTITGIAISPLLGTGVYGAYQYITAPDAAARAQLPWFAQPKFFVPALLIVLACLLKDSLGTVLPPGLKKPFDVLETLENKASGLLAAGAVVPFTVDSLRGVIGGGNAGGLLSMAGDHAHTAGAGLAMIHANLGAINFSWLLDILTVPLGIAIFAIVWMASHAINVLILLSPWGAIDAALKSARTALLGLVVVTAKLNPLYAAILSIVIIVIAWFIAGWSFRLMIFGTDFCWDIFTFRKHRFKVDARVNKLFSGARLPKVPVRTYGKLANEPENGLLHFTYRPWLVLPARTVNVKLDAPSIGKGLFFSTIRDGDKTIFTLPPRYRGHEEEMARAHDFANGVQAAGILKGWSNLKELFTGSAAKAQVA